MSVRNKIGIYSITNTANGKRYIGQSTDIYERTHTHKTFLRQNKHKNRCLQDDYNENENAFIFETLCYCAKEDLDEMERYYISLYQSTNPEYGYNTESGGYHHRDMSESTRKKLSERFSNGRANFLGKKHSPESLAKMSQSHKGHKLSEETKRRMSEAQKNRKPISEHTRKLLSEAKRGQNHHFYGKTFSDEHKAKLSAANSGSGNPMYGKTQTQRARRLIAIRKCKPVVCVETGEIYESTLEASDKTGACRSDIGKACNGQLSTCAKKHWRFATEEETQELKEKLFEEAYKM